MRDDLTKQLCEHERHGSSWGFGEVRNTKFNDQYKSLYDVEEDDKIAVSATSACREGMKRRYGWNTKSFGEHLAPLYGAIRKAVGRKWDDFYSELSQAFDRRSVTGQHIFQHLFDRIPNPADTIITPDGEVAARRFYGGPYQLIKGSVYEYYVDPRDGIIKANKHCFSYNQRQRERRVRATQEQLKVVRKLSDTEEYRKDGDLWFHCTIQRNAGTSRIEYEKATYSNRTIGRRVVDYPAMYCHWKRTFVYSAEVVVKKRQASSKEIKEHNLT